MAFTGLFRNDSLRTMGKALELDCSGRPLSHHACEGTREHDKKFSHFLPAVDTPPENIIASA